MNIYLINSPIYYCNIAIELVFIVCSMTKQLLTDKKYMSNINERSTMRVYMYILMHIQLYMYSYMYLCAHMYIANIHNF